MNYAAPRGTNDLLPTETPLWQFLENSCRQTFHLFNYSEIRTPIFEATELFARSIGSTTDIVKKEMYTFADRKGRSLTLRPEATAAVVRAGLESNLISPDSLTKLYYIGPMFRYERPQAGRQRQFHQAGVEAFGSSDPKLDAEMVALSVKLFENLGLKELQVNINSVGCRECQPDFRQAIKAYFQKNIKQMCQDCQERLEQNPLRILDCKEATCQKFIAKAPAAVDLLCQECSGHFNSVKSTLNSLKIKYQVNDRLVRGLDYYTKTAFEIITKQLGAQNAVCGGGRYDNLVEDLGGKPTPAVGFAIGLERVVELLKQASHINYQPAVIDLFIATIGEKAQASGFELLAAAREAGIAADLDYLGRSLKGQMRTADRLGAKYVYIVGEDELEKKSAALKNMRTAEQQTISFDQLIRTVKA